MRRGFTIQGRAGSNAIAAAFALSACGGTTGWRTAGGAAMDAAGDALIGSVSSNAGKVALIGAIAGAVGGYLYDKHRKGNID